MRPHHATALVLLACLLGAPLHAEPPLPAADDKEGWSRLIDLFAECSAVYNLAATLRESPDQGGMTYRELANGALIAGLASTQRLGLSDSYIESVYTVKFNQWQSGAKDGLLAKADQCLAESLTLQNHLVGDLRQHANHR